VRDIGKGSAVNEGRAVLERLHQIGRDRIAQQRRHGPGGLQVASGDRPALQRGGHHNAREPCLQVAHAGGQAQDRHDLGGDHDVKAVLARIPVAWAPQPHHNLAQGPIVHVDDPLPADTPSINAQGVAVVNVVVDQRRQQVVRQRDGLKVAREVQVDVFHRHHLRPSATGGATLHAKDRAQRGLAQTHDGTLADAVEGITEPDCGGGLALAGGRGVDPGHQHQPSVGTIL
jgi:hypothetical protein